MCNLSKHNEVMHVEELRQQFHIFDLEVYGKPLMYFDNAATSQRPKCVIDKLLESNSRHNANIHRAVHTLSAQATEAYEAGRDAARAFINAPSREEVIFTSGATAAINLVAYSFGERFIAPGDEIIVGEAEHHSNFVPWQQLALRKGAKVVYLPVSENDTYSVEDLKRLISPRTKLLCIAHASNVLGLLNPVEQLVAQAHSLGVPVLVDGAQAIVHTAVDVQKLDCDFYVFSAHKVYGPTGVGVLYGKREYLDAMPPFMCGGEMVGTVSTSGTTFAPLPMKFEAGTQNFNNVAALPEAFALATTILKDNELNESLEEATDYLLDELLSIEGLTLYGLPASKRGGASSLEAAPIADKLPIFSFTVEGVHHEDLALLLDKMAIAVRSGQMCAEPLMNHFGVTGMLRVSLLPYNTKTEAIYFISCLRKAIAMLK